MTNKEIVENNLDLIRRCVDCQFAGVKDKQFKEDFFHDLLLILYEYDLGKLGNAVRHNHLNALITRIIVNNIWSSTSPYYKDYYKFQNKADDLSELIKKDEGEEEE